MNINFYTLEKSKNFTEIPEITYYGELYFKKVFDYTILQLIIYKLKYILN